MRLLGRTPRTRALQLAWLVAALAIASAFAPEFVLTVLPAVALLLLAGRRPGEALIDRMRARRRGAVAAVRGRPSSTRRREAVRPLLGRRFVAQALAMRPPPALSS